MVQDLNADQTWWVYAAAGVAAILFGLVALFFPGLTLALFILFFGIFAIVDGVINLIDMFRRIGERRTWWPQLVIGIVGIAAGLFVFAYPGITALILLYVIAFWAIFVGMLEIFASFATGQLLLFAVGLLSALFGFILLANPGRGALALVMVIGIFWIVRGIVLLVQSFTAPSAAAFPR